ncbi:MAG: hypothetical protein LUH18_02710 [Oscillospiraceae bacterium]|nr:hypothetical protein [Oscillospiraceae bacterium]
MAKRIMCIIISVLMIVSLLPTGVFAVENDSGESAPEVVLTSTADADSDETTDEGDASSNNAEEGGETGEAEAEENAEEGTEEVILLGAEANTSVAKIGDVEYESLSAAVAAVPTDSTQTTITLTADTTESSAVTIESGKNIILDLGSYTLDLGSYTAIVSGTLTIQGSGTITITSAESYSAIQVEGSTAKVTLNSGSIVNNGTYGYGIYCCDGGTAVINGGSITSQQAALAGNNTTGDMNFEVNGGELTATYGAAIYMPGQMTLKITGGTINGGISLRMGQVTITGGTINATTNTSNIDSISQYYNYSGNVWLGDALYVMGGTYTSSDGTYSNSLSLTITGGTFNCSNSGCNAVTIYNLGYVTQTSTVTISDGTFTGGSGYAVVDFSSLGVENVSYGVAGNTVSTSITGGTYSSDVSAYVADGYAYDSTTGTVSDAQVASVTSSDGATTTTYSTLADAISAASSGDTITLLSDVTESGAYNTNGLYQVSTNVTLDLDSHTLTVDTTRVFGVLNGGSLTVKNGTVKIADGATATGTQFNILRGTCSFTAENVTFDGNNIAANFLHVAAGGTATISLTNCNITNQSGGVVVYDESGDSTVTLTGCNYVKNPVGGSLSSATITFNQNNIIGEGSTNYEASGSINYTYIVANGGSVTANLTLASSASLKVEEGGSVTGTVKVDENASLTVSGGTVSGTITTSGTFTMTGGTITASTGASQAVLVKGGTVNISAGTINTGSSRALVFDTDVTVSGTISGGTFIGNDIALLARSSSGNTVSVTGGTYTASKGIDLVASILATGYGVFDTEGNPATVSGNYYSSSLNDYTVTIGTGVAKIDKARFSPLSMRQRAATPSPCWRTRKLAN